MKLTEYKEVTKREKVTIGYKCDNCGKVHNGNSMPDDWHEFSGHHNSWGNEVECDVNLMAAIADKERGLF